MVEFTQAQEQQLGKLFPDPPGTKPEDTLLAKLTTLLRDAILGAKPFDDMVKEIVAVSAPIAPSKAEFDLLDESMSELIGKLQKDLRETRSSLQRQINTLTNQLAQIQSPPEAVKTKEVKTEAEPGTAKDVIPERKPEEIEPVTSQSEKPTPATQHAKGSAKEKLGILSEFADQDQGGDQ